MNGTPDLESSRFRFRRTEVNEDFVLGQIGNLPTTIRTLLTDPFQRDYEEESTTTIRTLLTDPFQRDYVVEPIHLTLASASFLHPNATILGPTWTSMHDVMQDAEGDAKLAAFMAADTLLHQAQLPIEDRLLTKRIRRGKKDKTADDLIASYTDFAKKPRDSDTEIARKIVEEDIRAYKKELDELFDSPIASEDTARGRINFLDSMAHFVQNESDLFEFWKDGESPTASKYSQPYRNHVTSIAHSPYSAPLLFNGELETVNLGIKHAIWMGAMVRYRNNLDDSNSEADGNRLLDYFFADGNSELQHKFWEIFAIENIRSRFEEVPSSAPDIQKIPLFSPFINIEAFLIQDPETISRFFGTIPHEDYSDSEKRELLKRLTAATAAFQTLRPDHPNSEHIRSEIAGLSQALSMKAVVDEDLAILADQVPGAIFTDSNQRIKARSEVAPSPDKVILYASKNKASHNKAPEKNRRIDNPDELDLKQKGESQFLRYWGEVQAPRAKSVKVIVEHMQRRFGGTKPNEFKLTDQLSPLQQEARKTGGKDPAVFPALLKPDHPLHALDKIGVVGVVPQKSGFLILIDAKEAGIQTKGPNLMTISAEVDDQNDLVIDGIPTNDFAFSPLHLALNAAALLTRKPVVPESLSRDEEKEINGTMKGWKQKGKGKGFPTLALQDANSLDQDNLHVLYFAGNKNKPVLLTVQATAA